MNNQFTAAPFDGGGFEKLSINTMRKHIVKPHTGFIYTPPRFSDHIAISLKLSLGKDKKLTEVSQIDLNCSKTKKAQPHKKQRTIQQFFKRQKTK